MQSMTGYGTAGARAGGANLVVEARALNHRFLDVRVRFPFALADHAAVVEEAARKALVRGRVELSARIEGALEGRASLDRARARHALNELDLLRQELGFMESVPFSLLAVVPNLFSESAVTDPTTIREAVLRATDAACVALMAMRRKEGEALMLNLQARITAVRESCARLTAQVSSLSEVYLQRLRARLATLLASTSIALDTGRLEHEAVLLADRSDVAEELTRIESHCAQFMELLSPSDEPVGRRLEFLLQELSREVNTLGSKVGELQVTRQVLDLKSELERLREQVQNVL